MSKFKASESFKNWFIYSDFSRFYKEVYLPASRLLNEIADLPSIISTARSQTDVNDLIATISGVEYDYKMLIKNTVASKLKSAPEYQIEDYTETATSELVLDLTKPESTLSKTLKDLRDNQVDPRTHLNSIIRIIKNAVGKTIVDEIRRPGAAGLAGSARWVYTLWDKVSEGDFSGFPDQFKARSDYDSLVGGGDPSKVKYYDKEEFLKKNKHREVPRQLMSMGALQSGSGGARDTFNPAVTNNPAKKMADEENLNALQQGILAQLRASYQSETKKNKQENLLLAIQMIKKDFGDEPEAPSFKNISEKYKDNVLGFEVTQNRYNESLKAIKAATERFMLRSGYADRLARLRSEDEDDDV